jgi:succinoglycan biosynthesis protein ExoU
MSAKPDFPPASATRFKQMSSATAGFATAVIITAKDAASTAARAVSTALAQQCVREVVFVDDASADSTSAVAASADDGSGRLKIIRLGQNRGPAHGRNIAIDASSSPFLCILDADDFMAPARLDRLFANGGDGWDMLADDVVFVRGTESDEIGRLLPDDIEPPCQLSLSRFVLGNIPNRRRYRRELGFLKPVIRRAFIEQQRLRYDERLRLGEDFLFYAACLAEGAVFRVVEACGYYAVERSNSLSVVHKTSDIAALHQALVEFEIRLASAGRPAGMLAECTRSARNNLALREALDAKRAGGWLGFFGACAKAPSSLFYIFSELLRANIAAAARPT